MLRSLSWASLAKPPILSTTTVHVWWVRLLQSPDVVERCAVLLSDEERQRAARFVFPRDQRRFTVARACLRRLLGMYLDEDAKVLPLTTGLNQKPCLFPRDGHPHSLRFNVSHSHEAALLAFTMDRELGIDLEYQRDVQDWRGIVARFFAPEEEKAIQALSPTLQRAAFFACWTRKEAFMKAISLGFSLPLERFVVSVSPHEEAALLEVEGKITDREGWPLFDLSVPVSNYRAALCVQREPGSTRFALYQTHRSLPALASIQGWTFIP